MFDFGEVVALMSFAGVLVMAGVFLGGWLVFKSRNATQGEKFLGGVPNGTVFTIPDAAEDDLDAEKSILDKSKDFLKIFEGGSK
jgi:hypothetical protein